MPYSLNASAEFRSAYTQDHFGGNFLFNRDSLGQEGSYEDLISDLRVETVRFPGGSVSERYFDISNPNNTLAIDEETGEEVRLVSLENWLDVAGELDISTTIVIPTKNFLSEEVDDNGDRFPEFDHNQLRQFITGIARGEYGSGQIQAFEIGNEYWGAGQMSSVEYGRLSSEMATVINEALNDAQLDGFPTEQIDIIVQAGTNFNFARLDENYTDLSGSDEILNALSDEFGIDFSRGFTFANGEVNWTRVNNELIMSEYDQDEIEAIDGVSTHIYTRGDISPDMRDFSTRMIDETWGERDDRLETYVTEWNLKSTSSLNEDSDYGLNQAHELLEILEQFPEHGVDVAYAWPLLQNTRNAFSLGFEHNQLTVGGEMFRLMEECLPGNRPIDLIGSSREETELEAENVDVHAFGNPNQLVLFLTSQSTEITSTDFDLSGLLSGGDEVSVSYLGVADGSAPGSRHAVAEVEEASSSEISEEIYRDGVLHVDLDALEVMRVVISQPSWSAEMQTYWEAVGFAEAEHDGIDGVFDGEDLVAALSVDPDPDPPIDEPESDDDDGEFDDGGGLGIAAIALGLIPLLALLL